LSAINGAPFHLLQRFFAHAGEHKREVGHLGNRLLVFDLD
jgi:hypothetical protein